MDAGKGVYFVILKSSGAMYPGVPTILYCY